MTLAKLIQTLQELRTAQPELSEIQVGQVANDCESINEITNVMEFNHAKIYKENGQLWVGSVLVLD